MQPGEVNTAAGQDAEREERRPRSRDRYGRDRRERAPRDEAGSPDTSAAEPMTARDEQVAAPAVQIAAPVAPAPVLESVGTTASAAAPVAAPAEASAGRGAMPRVTPFALPTADLAQIAQGAGLQWVNSDAERVAQVQASIAAEPKPIHVPRERPVPVKFDDDVILVETRRDLSNVVLPFEDQKGADTPAA